MTTMRATGYARYVEGVNALEVVRPGENLTRRIHCTNLNPSANRVYAVEVHGDEIWVLAGPLTNQRPSRKYIYRFSSLAGGISVSI
jgi:hypothetical protein